MADNAELTERRARLLGPNVATFYDEPVHIVRGQGVWLWDAEGRKYLDCYNNVAHVSHANERVVEAIRSQAATLNTHTRYLSETILDYVERLTATFDAPLSSAILTCTGSEANDIALRMAEAATGNRGIIATDYTYHGNTALVSQLSRSNAPAGGFGLDQFVRFVPAPDSLRPLGGVAGESHAQTFAAAVSEQIGELQRAGHGFAAMILCPYFLNEGFPSLDAGWLQPAVKAVKDAGGLIIADEVQPGFGRLGSHMWGHQFRRFTPDIVTMGKPMANGHPVGGVVTSAGIMAEFRETFRYFNTFGGNPVSCAASMAVLDVLEDEHLMANAARVGQYALTRLTELARNHEIIADVRGRGLIFGAEFVTDRATLNPATGLVHRIVNEMRQRVVLLSSVGRHKNMLKIRPPMPFSNDDVDLLIETLAIVLEGLSDE